MPELPEIEHLRRTLSPVLIGATVMRVRLDRPDIIRPVRGSNDASRARNGHVSSSPTPRPRLLRGEQITSIERRGKELAIVAQSGHVLGVHLGMSGQVLLLERGRRLDDSRHVHCTWWVGNGGQSHRMVFRDPRRFGGLWAIDSREQLELQHWAVLGPDALTIPQREFKVRLGGTCRAVKSALLDQKLLAGVGNIYADESLHAARIHPLRVASDLHDAESAALHRAVRRTLRRAIDAGGSTIRDYRDGRGDAGRFARRHRVYGRAELPCLTCRVPLEHLVVSQRTTTFCPRCQPVP